jgi:hypothetical protein
MEDNKQMNLPEFAALMVTTAAATATVLIVGRMAFNGIKILIK